MYVIEQFVQIVHMPAQDRRITKTRKAIYSAFLQLLNQKGYETITVQEIIDLADVGRSTFYRWVFGSAGKIVIEGPVEVRNAYKKLLQKSLDSMN